MKKIALILILPIIFMVVGCGEDAAEVIDAPGSLAIESASGLDITFNWVESETGDIDGYIFYLDNSAFDTIKTKVNNGTVTPTGLGDITIKAYKEEETSDASNAVSTSLYPETDLTIYDFDVANKPSGIGWDEEGVSTIYNFTTANEAMIDLYLDKAFDLASPDTYSKWNTCKIQMVSSDIEEAPASDYLGGAPPYADSTYVVKLPGHGTDGGDQYLKLTVNSVNTDTSVTFDYSFQKIEGYTRLK